ncbi:hypothetical protein BN8_05076 [Fibrisoma limi BUZ 3]|uniref:Uncharacterized protein n=1 Tax=Fibrisoma limi BUZ 3 TaxID=1185876 RepID=I2GPG1_9BACT|nr:hypothetical protein [Fibrisoma limi]CCH55789.1 hypothetical protein BN8_05076 [Fibrisoma limi BUZ 3]
MAKLYQAALISDEYTLNNLVWHLLESKQYEKIHKLLLDAPDWLNAKAKRFSGDLSFLSDLNQVIQRSNSTSNFQDITKLFTVHAARFTVYHRMGRYNYNALEALVWLGKETEALNHTRARPNILSGNQLSAEKSGIRGASVPQGENLLGLMRIYRALYKRDGVRTAEIKELEEDILNNIKELKNDQDYYQAVDEFVKILISCGQLDLAESLINSRQIESKTDNLKRLLINLYITSGQLKKAIKLISEEDKYDQENYYSDLVKKYAQLDQISKAQSIINKITSKWRKPGLSLELVLPYAKKKQYDKVESILNQEVDLKLARTMCQLAIYFIENQLNNYAYEIIKQIELIIDLIPAWGPHHDDWTAEELRSYALMDLAQVYVQINMTVEAHNAFDRAEDYINQINYSYAVHQATAELLRSMVQVGFYERAILLVSTPPFLNETWFQVIVIAELVEKKQFELAVQLSNKIKSSKNKVDALLCISIGLAKQKLFIEAEEKYQESFDELRNLPDYKNYIELCCNISHTLFIYNDKRSLAILSLAVKTLYKLISTEREEISRNETKNPHNYMLNFQDLGKFEHDIKRVVVELLRHQEYISAVELLIFCRYIYIYNNSIEETDIIESIYKAKNHLTKDGLFTLLDFFNITEKSGILYHQITCDDELSDESKINKLQSSLEDIVHNKHDRSKVLLDLIKELIRQNKPDLIEKYFYNFDKRSSKDTTQYYNKSFAIWVNYINKSDGLAKTHSLIKKYGNNAEWLNIILIEIIKECAHIGNYSYIEHILNENKIPFIYVEAIKVLSSIGNVNIATKYLDELKSIKPKSTYDWEEQMIDALISVIRAQSSAGNNYLAKLLIDEAFSLVKDKDLFYSGENVNYNNIVEVMMECGYFIEAFNKLKFSQEDSLIKLILRLAQNAKTNNIKKYGCTYIDILTKVAFIYSWEKSEWREISQLLTYKISDGNYLS